jgi:hypothetical protein
LGGIQCGNSIQQTNKQYIVSIGRRILHYCCIPVGHRISSKPLAFCCLSSQGMGSLSAASQAYLVTGDHGVEPLLSEIPEKELCIVALVAAHPQFLAIQQDYLVMAVKPWMNLLHLGNVHER